LQFPDHRRVISIASDPVGRTLDAHRHLIAPASGGVGRSTPASAAGR
jgi:hypothetical protein